MNEIVCIYVRVAGVVRWNTYFVQHPYTHGKDEPGRINCADLRVDDGAAHRKRTLLPMLLSPSYRSNRAA